MPDTEAHVIRDKFLLKRHSRLELDWKSVTQACHYLVVADISQRA